MTTTRDQIMNEAESRLRFGGYKGFSFRDIATAVAVKSASVHHHFPTKEALVLAVTERYHRGFMEALGPAELAGRSPQAALRRYARVFLDAFRDSRSTCLCGMLSAESRYLPDAIRDLLRQTAEDNVRWLERAVVLNGGGRSSKSSRARSTMIYTAMEGAIHLSALLDDEAPLKDVLSGLLDGRSFGADT